MSSSALLGGAPDRASDVNGLRIQKWRREWGHFPGASHTAGNLLISLNLHLVDNQRTATILKAILHVDTISPKEKPASIDWRK